MCATLGVAVAKATALEREAWFGQLWPALEVQADDHLWGWAEPAAEVLVEVCRAVGPAGSRAEQEEGSLLHLRFTRPLQEGLPDGASPPAAEARAVAVYSAVAAVLVPSTTAGTPTVVAGAVLAGTSAVPEVPAASAVSAVLAPAAVAAAVASVGATMWAWSWSYDGSYPEGGRGIEPSRRLVWQVGMLEGWKSQPKQTFGGFIKNVTNTVREEVLWSSGNIRTVLGSVWIESAYTVVDNDELYLALCAKQVELFTPSVVTSLVGYPGTGCSGEVQVQETGWRIVGRVALPNRTRKRRSVVQFPWELAEGSE
ncbi:hypothetical protein Taro_048440 [Colocasia esculenta]|uniref:Uncharacterized protein n=1 Tax=Colocasia esculenta TaxID=4460 RepID=A0A843WY65_COLES|nr:hypothetical protein [Colocasia esculenta]